MISDGVPVGAIDGHWGEAMGRLGLELVAAESVVATALAIALLAWLAPILGLVDSPGPRHSHEKPTPRIGGLAIALAFALVLLIGSPTRGALGAGTDVSARVLPGFFAMTLLGALDDRLRDRFHWVPKLALQVAIAAWFAWPLGFSWGCAVAGFLVIAVNAMNWLDHANLLLGLAAIPGAAALPPFHAAAIVGALAVFLAANLRGIAFAGDAGSHGLGFLIAASAIASAQVGDPLAGVGLAAVLLALPLMDFGVVIGIRIGRGIRPWKSTADHLRHRGNRRSAGVGRLCLAGVVLWGLGGGALLFAESRDIGGLRFSDAANFLGILAAVLVMIGSPPFRPRVPRSDPHQSPQPPG
jgi:UDP-N-acetylmuramyl pentapeptide phosphotransferase/UDP-N-acetylglucosamine-1-phosphate transferase